MAVARYCGRGTCWSWTRRPRGWTPAGPASSCNEPRPSACMQPPALVVVGLTAGLVAHWCVPSLPLCMHGCARASLHRSVGARPYIHNLNILWSSTHELLHARVSRRVPDDDRA